MIINPKNLLSSFCGKSVNISLKWGIVYKGVLESFDSYMNIKINGAEEWVNEKKIGNLGQILIRCNNIAYIAQSSD